ncbi:inorganic triphosphatase [Erwinia tracheiphila]|uniref:Inorganic triphosphatase n=1 Tax=Erwinia tracheiphila TaxID=65700 RepID=A0A345CY53_9GAMM|nr:inorganic triphosphatase [Erwinia tracheiphila]AXF78370.1 inorganic triphosphatase [Erwinia tracheiphila]UIA82896.1 inorganic triphosphatase [Erwinia tracheiphila]UIA91484.1 inorganic triphosphatase [Erwinia tracheiphila]
MTIEIELKFIVTPEGAQKLPELLLKWPHQHSEGQKLTNIYYETADGQLRKGDMGLRIRGFGDRYEMTLKTAGQAVGGLHQRPEYNVMLNKPELDITQFPPEIWPKGCDLVALQQKLKPLFSTHFVREKWVVTYLSSEIEVAFDRGDVKAGELSETINEIELELKNGQRDELLAFASELTAMGGLRLGSLSKAARGYALAKGNPPRELRPVPIMKTELKTTVEQGMCAAFILGLNQWQYHEELWLRGNPAARVEIQRALETIRQAFSLFGSLVPRKASGELRQLLSTLEQQFQEKNLSAEALCYSSLSLKAQLALTYWLVSERWRSFIDAKADARLQGSFKRFSDIMLGRVSADLKETFAQVQQLNEYQDKLTRLHRQLLAAHLLAGAYDSDAVAIWIDNWQQLAQAIESGQHNLLESQCRQVIRQSVFWKNGNI